MERSIHSFAKASIHVVRGNFDANLLYEENVLEDFLLLIHLLENFKELQQQLELLQELGTLLMEILIMMAKWI